MTKVFLITLYFMTADGVWHNHVDYDRDARTYPTEAACVEAQESYMAQYRDLFSERTLLKVRCSVFWKRAESDG